MVDNNTTTKDSDADPTNRPAPRQTEPLPADWRPLKRFLLGLFAVTLAIAAAAIVVDRSIYG